MAKKQPVLIYVTSISVRECETTSQVCLYVYIFIKTACLSVFWMYNCDECRLYCALDRKVSNQISLITQLFLI